MQHLQLAVDLLYSIFRLANEEECKQIQSVMSQVALLRSRLPGIEGTAPLQIPSTTLTGCLAEIWTARNQLNRLQDRINVQKKKLTGSQST